jgi:hypothetical protein
LSESADREEAASNKGSTVIHGVVEESVAGVVADDSRAGAAAEDLNVTIEEKTEVPE